MAERTLALKARGTVAACAKYRVEDFGVQHGQLVVLTAKCLRWYTPEGTLARKHILPRALVDAQPASMSLQCSETNTVVNTMGHVLNITSNGEKYLIGKHGYEMGASNAAGHLQYTGVEMFAVDLYRVYKGTQPHYTTKYTVWAVLWHGSVASISESRDKIVLKHKDGPPEVLHRSEKAICRIEAAPDGTYMHAYAQQSRFLWVNGGTQRGARYAHGGRPRPRQAGHVRGGRDAYPGAASGTGARALTRGVYADN